PQRDRVARDLRDGVRVTPPWVYLSKALRMRGFRFVRRGVAIAWPLRGRDACRMGWRPRRGGRHRQSPEARGRSRLSPAVSASSATALTAVATSTLAPRAFE